MTKDEALKLALEALEEINQLSIGENAVCLPAEIDTAMDAIKEALAQPEQEPKCGAIIEVFGKDWRLEYLSLPVGKHKLYTQQYTYTTPPQRKPLSDEEILTYRHMIDWTAEWSYTNFARAIEAAHGIKGEA